jgi:hypothetical protein
MQFISLQIQTKLNRVSKKNINRPNLIDLGRAARGRPIITFQSAKKKQIETLKSGTHMSDRITERSGTSPLDGDRSGVRRPRQYTTGGDHIRAARRNSMAAYR